MVLQNNARRGTGLLTILCASLALAGCQFLREATGTTKHPPDEFAVERQAPLMIPPDFNLRPPQAGALPRYALDAASEAKRALFPNSAIIRAAVIDDRGYSDSEIALLQSAKALDSNPGIRRIIASEAPLYDKAPKLADKVLARPAALRLHVAQADLGVTLAANAPAGALPQQTSVASETTEAIPASEASLRPASLPIAAERRPMPPATTTQAASPPRAKLLARATLSQAHENLLLRPAFDR